MKQPGSYTHMVHSRSYAALRNKRLCSYQGVVIQASFSRSHHLHTNQSIKKKEKKKKEKGVVACSRFVCLALDSLFSLPQVATCPCVTRSKNTKQARKIIELQ
jgi:hypothetical protein